MSKISLRELNSELKRCKIGIDSDSIELTPYTAIGAEGSLGPISNLVSYMNRKDDARFDNKVQMINLEVYDIDKINALFLYEQS